MNKDEIEKCAKDDAQTFVDTLFNEYGENEETIEYIKHYADEINKIASHLN